MEIEPIAQVQSPDIKIFQTNLVMVQNLIERSHPFIGPEKFLFHELEGKDTKMAAFIRGLRNQDIRAFTEELETYVIQQEARFEEMIRAREQQKALEAKKEENARLRVPPLSQLENMTVSELKDWLRQSSLAVGGKKAELIERLENFRQRDVS
jgi:hypothetical protein